MSHIKKEETPPKPKKSSNNDKKVAEGKTQNTSPEGVYWDGEKKHKHMICF